MFGNRTKTAKLNGRESVFVKRKRTFTLIFVSFIALFLLSSLITDYNAIGGFLSLPKAFVWSIKNLVPNATSWPRVPLIFDNLVETALLSVAVTVCSAVCAFFFSLLGTRTMRVNPVVGRAVRIIAAFFRNIPDIVWALLLLFAFHQNILSGFFALFFATFGLLTRTFIETIDEISASCVEALHATGATNLQVVSQGIIPSSMATLISWILYMIETNVRNAVLIGILTGTGIGWLFDLFYKRGDWGAVSLVVLAVVILIIVIEMISTQIRKVIM
ncbi:MAG: ABC transporter permease subunit [Dehalococcoidia bacterium]|nr:ABC transporter permease subunit [Dehalococcoidia bacterium]